MRGWRIDPKKQLRNLAIHSGNILVDAFRIKEHDYDSHSFFFHFFVFL